MDGIGALARRYGFDAVLVVGAVGTAVDVALRRSALRSSVLPGWFGVLAASVLVLALLGRHGWPFGAPALVWLLGAALAFTDGRLVITAPGVSAAGLVAAFLLGEVDDERLARAALVIVLAGAACVVYNDPHHAAGDFVFVPVPFAIAWLAGYALRERASRAATAEQRVRQVEHDREAAARVAVAEERARIARELHDVVAHSVSVMVVQAQAGTRLVPDPQRASSTFQTIEHSGREALVELRRMLGILRTPDEQPTTHPQPGLAGLDALVAHVAEAGVAVQCVVEGEPRQLPPGVDLSAYRIIQEALTNTLKHAGAAQARVVLRYLSSSVEIEVLDDGRGSRAGVNGSGHGLIGMRERAALHGGDLSTGPRADGGYAVVARLPLQGVAR
jgi:signal transduction histidine kinase